MAKIGKKIRELRQRRNLGVRELAQRSGVSHSTISLLERDKVGKTSQVLEAGDGYYFDSRQPHTFRTAGGGESQIISAVTPPTY